MVDGPMIGGSVVDGSSVVYLLSRDGFVSGCRRVTGLLSLARMGRGRVFAVGRLPGGRGHGQFGRMFVGEKGCKGMFKMRISLRRCFAFAARQVRGSTIKCCRVVCNDFRAKLSGFVVSLGSSGLGGVS